MIHSFARSLWIITSIALIVSGCTHRQTEPPRTATEQFLISHAAMEALDRLDLRLLNGKTVFLDDSWYESVDKKFVVGEIRTRLLLAGARLVGRKDDAAVTIEVRTPGVGIDRRSFLVGIPELGFPMPTGQTIAIPEIALFKINEQRGRAEVALVAVDRATSRALYSVGPSIGETVRTEWTILLIAFVTTRNMPY